MGELLQILSISTGMLESDLCRIIDTAPRRYKHYTIPKRNGQRRPIDQPAKEVKTLQRVLVQYLLDKCPIHDCATAYQPKSSIKKNAAKHADQEVILKLDFNNFFPSITGEDWEAYCLDKQILDVDDIEISKQLFFMTTRYGYKLKLSIGAPSSPFISNVMMHDFDDAISQSVSKDKVIYTRYADDLIFSAPRVGHLRYVEKSVRELLKNLSYPRLYLNNQKRVLATKKYKRNVTGLIITNEGNVSLGRDKKRMISAAVHHVLNGKKTPEEILSIRGQVAFARSIEPDFFTKLERKYGYPLLKILEERE